MALNFLPAWNRRKVFKTLGFLPVIFTLGLLFWSLYAYTGFVLPRMYRNGRFLCILWALLWLTLWVLTTWSYFICVFRNPGNPVGVVSRQTASHGQYHRIPSRAAAAVAAAAAATAGFQPGSTNRQTSSTQHRRYADDAHSLSSSSRNSSDMERQLEESDRASEYSDDSNGQLTEEQLQRTELVYAITVKDNGQPRFCQKCNAPKPDRTHHCSICGICVLKMDHHCPWLNNCVGFHTQKAFLLFICHGTLYVSSVFVTTVIYFLHEFVEMDGGDEVNVNAIVLMILSAVFSLCLVAFAGFHIYLVLSNLTTIESYERNHFKVQQQQGLRQSKYVNLFDVGAKKNFYQVFGSTWYWWFVPVTTTMGDGVRFPINYESYNELHHGA
ncbi:palmitoyltransferase for Vac8p [Linderina pennispora]|nr:palmitoyltransferase for Vac8p [Linderina pennispora]